jgi:hypothetical protein
LIRQIQQTFRPLKNWKNKTCFFREQKDN